MGQACGWAGCCGGVQQLRTRVAAPWVHWAVHAYPDQTILGLFPLLFFLKHWALS